MTTIRAIAKKLNLSPATVSRVLKEDPAFKISNETKEKILQTVQELGYKPRKYNNKQSIHIGILMSLTYTYGDSFFYDILAGIQEYCSKHDVVISLIANYEQFHDNYSHIENQLKQLDGLIVTDLPNQREEFLSSLHCKFVFIDHFVPGYANIGYDKVHANQLIMNHLFQSHYQKIAYIGGTSDDNYYHPIRLMVYKNALDVHGINFDSSYLFDCQWNAEICAEKVDELLERHPDVEAIFAGSDALATTVISRLKELGKNCPDDIAVVGFNNNPLSANFDPPITTVDLPSKQMGYEGAKLLSKQIKTNTQYNYQLLLPVELIVRQSTKKE
ncbi:MULTISPECIES: LacI family DNA-binding transcriptional regulator [Terrabacteria group]|uniref:LacI family DNA-binding transcriptional regulator n=1 Tax=Bacillati TaxID=1783272 RepID=UPI00193A660D|nr:MULTISPECIES: LacI family DNA-binding transcriptional regulator [Terrabacteria group]MBW9212177.1 LacI family transcriptional regulator [Trueperella sp. zg.1013]QRG86278.1 LacI family DNA-binding transcriptional regulator [Bulleidia sp. zg-1006]